MYLLQKNKKTTTKKDTRHSYCTYKTESAPLSIHVFTTHTITTQRFTYSAGSTFGSKLSDKLVQYIKQINTYIYSTYIENEG